MSKRHPRPQQHHAFVVNGELDTRDAAEVIAPHFPNMSLDGLRELIRTGAISVDDQRQPAKVPRSKRPRCGAKTRSGRPCQAPGIGRGGRCKLHGGRSTGAKTQEGIERLSAAVRARWERWRRERGIAD